jgi:hypothetical protein
MTPPDWHSQIFALTYDELQRIDDPRESQLLIMFVKHGEIHMKVFYSDAECADQPSQADVEVSRRIGALQGTPAEAYATVRLVIWNGSEGDQCWAICVSGAESDDAHESTWLQRVEFTDNGTLNRKEFWKNDDVKSENAINPWATP